MAAPLRLVLLRLRHRLNWKLVRLTCLVLYLVLMMAVVLSLFSKDIDSALSGLGAGTGASGKLALHCSGRGIQRPISSCLKSRSLLPRSHWKSTSDF